MDNKQPAGSYVLTDGSNGVNFVAGPTRYLTPNNWLADASLIYACIGDYYPQAHGGYSPNGSWCHYIALPHRGGDYHTAYMYIPFFNNPELYVSSSPGGQSGNGGTLARMYSSFNSNPSRITSNSPGYEYLWAY